MVKRPLGINVSYLNEEGDEIEEDIYEFKARVFMHEVDHVNGKMMTHWRLNEGNIEVLDSESYNLYGVIKISPYNYRLLTFIIRRSRILRVNLTRYWKNKRKKQ
jgi:hypothetical protein